MKENDFYQIKDWKFQVLVDKDFEKDLFLTLKTSKKEIYLQFLTFEADKIGNKLSEILLEKVKKKIKIKILIDWFINFKINDTFLFLPTKKSFLALKEWWQTLKLIKKLRNNQIEIKVINSPLKLNFFRNHKKLILIDGKITYLGGFNISEHNFFWHDFALKIENQKLNFFLKKEFLSDWENKNNLKPERFETTLENTSKILILRKDKKQNLNEIYSYLLEKIKTAKNSIYLETPYLSQIPLIFELKKAAQRKVKIKIILPQKNNLLIYRLLKPFYRSFFNHPNIEIFWYQKTSQMTHLKCIIIDEKISIFGSPNFNLFDNFFQELAIAIEDKNLAKILIEKIFKNDIKNSSR